MNILSHLYLLYLCHFILQCMKLKPSLKVCRGMQQKLLDSHAAGVGGASSELNSSDSGSET